MNLRCNFIIAVGKSYSLCWPLIGCIYGVLETNKKNFGSNRNKPKQDLFRVVSVCFVKPKTKNFGLFWCFNLYQNKWNKQNCFETNRNNPKFSEKYQNMLSVKLFQSVFCLFQFNQNIKTLCFGIEPKQPKQTVLKKRKKQNNPKFCEKNTKICSLSHCSVVLLFVLVQSKHRCFGIEPNQPKQTLCFG
jgi:hypothetical protein